MTVAQLCGCVNVVVKGPSSRLVMTEDEVLVDVAKEMEVGIEILTPEGASVGIFDVVVSTLGGEGRGMDGKDIARDRRFEEGQQEGSKKSEREGGDTMARNRHCQAPRSAARPCQCITYLGT